jgi:hypothetical protein
MFLKFLSLAGRALSPIIVGSGRNKGTQHIWADAVFIRDIFKQPEMPPQKLLKLAMLAYIYGRQDLTYHCFQHYDKLKGTDLKGLFFALDSIR